MGQKNLAVLTGDRINEVLFTRKCMVVLSRGHKRPFIKKVAVIRRRKAGFLCTPSCKICLQILFVPFQNYGMQSLMTSGAYGS